MFSAPCHGRIPNQFLDSSRKYYVKAFVVATFGAHRPTDFPEILLIAYSFEKINQQKRPTRKVRVGLTSVSPRRGGFDTSIRRGCPTLTYFFLFFLVFSFFCPALSLLGPLLRHTKSHLSAEILNRREGQTAKV
jgi:hypothetical protein